MTRGDEIASAAASRPPRNDTFGCHCEERSDRVPFQIFDLERDEAISKRGNMNERQYYVYIMTNKRNNVLYTGVTNDLVKRVYEHKEKLVDGFTKKYNITKLVYFDATKDVEEAILKEKKIKAGSRAKKAALVESMNREWRDLYEEIV